MHTTRFVCLFVVLFSLFGCASQQERMERAAQNAAEHDDMYCKAQTSVPNPTMSYADCRHMMAQARITVGLIIRWGDKRWHTQSAATAT